MAAQPGGDGAGLAAAVFGERALKVGRAVFGFGVAPENNVHNGILI